MRTGITKREDTTRVNYAISCGEQPSGANSKVGRRLKAYCHN